MPIVESAGRRVGQPEPAVQASAATAIATATWPSSRHGGRVVAGGRRGQVIFAVVSSFRGSEPDAQLGARSLAGCSDAAPGSTIESADPAGSAGSATCRRSVNAALDSPGAVAQDGVTGV